MNTTNADYFTFNAHNSLLLIGQTGSGKSYLVHKFVEKYQAAMPPDELKFVFIDLKQVEFQIEGEDYKKEYLYQNVIIDPAQGFVALEQLDHLARKRAATSDKQPIIFIYIEENDMTQIDQEHFDSLVMSINENAKQANMKLIYSTSRPDKTSVSGELFQSFELVLSGPLADNDRERLELPPNPKSKYDFNVIELK